MIAIFIICMKRNSKAEIKAILIFDTLIHLADFAQFLYLYHDKTDIYYVCLW